MSPEQSFVSYRYPTRYSTPVREDDSSVYEPSTVYSQRSDVSFVSATSSHRPYLKLMMSDSRPVTLEV